jgi:hypothetical protein
VHRAMLRRSSSAATLISRHLCGRPAAQSSITFARTCLIKTRGPFDAYRYRTVNDAFRKQTALVSIAALVRQHVCHGSCGVHL